MPTGFRLIWINAAFINLASAQWVVLDKSCGDLMMTPFSTSDADLEQRLARRLLDVLIRATVLLAVALLC